jgi:hypothetical protein
MAPVRRSKNPVKYASAPVFVRFNDLTLRQLEKSWYNNNPISLAAQQNNAGEHIFFLAFPTESDADLQLGGRRRSSICPTRETTVVERN